MVVRYFTDVFPAVFFLSVCSSRVGVWIAALVGIFIIEGEVQFQVFVRKPDGTHTPSRFIIGVDALPVVGVLEEASLVLVKHPYRERELV